MGEGETLPLAKITTAERGVRCTKKGRTVELSDEVRKSCPINLLGPYFAEVNAVIVRRERSCRGLQPQRRSAVRRR